ncbi:MAG TPA: hypothetical protein VGN00_29450 [Puia sp.]|jgi:hypothetical protein
MKLEDRLKSLSAALAVITAEVVLFTIDSKKYPFWATHEGLQYSLGIALGLIFLLVLFPKPVSAFFNGIVMRRRKLLGPVVSKKTTTIDIQDIAGHKATYFQKASFSNIKNGDYILHLVSDPGVESSYINPQELQLANCSAQLDMPKKDLKLYFMDSVEKLNAVKSLYHVDKFYYFSVELVDCFTDQKGDSWDMTMFNYVKEFELNIHFPAGRRLTDVNVYRKEDQKETKVEAVSPILISRPDKDSIYLFITNFDQRDKLIIRWTYKRSPAQQQQPQTSSAMSQLP